MKQFEANGYRCTHDSDNPQGEIAVINTCGFISDAKEESINEILRLSAYKTEGKLKALIAAGCLSERFQEEILEELQALCRSTLTARNLANRASATAAGSPLQRTAEALGIECYSSPTTSDWMRIPVDALKMGPGDSHRSHKADEYILTREIAEGIDGYIAFIENLYGNSLE